MTSADCPYDNPGCVMGLCGTCNANTDCPSGLICSGANTCICDSSSVCGGDAPICEPGLGGADGGTCGCMSNSDCTTAGTVCNWLSGNLGQYPFGACVANCSNSSPGCDPNSAYPDCQTDGGSLQYGWCLPCLTDSECPVAGQKCTPGGCVSCVMDSDCVALDAGTPYCDGECVQCRTSADCSNGVVAPDGGLISAGCALQNTCAPFCTPGITGPCAQCDTDNDCPASDPTCFGGVCGPTGGFDAGGIPCGTDVCAGALGVCNTATNTCVECLTTSNCKGGGLCDTTTNSCVQCLTAADCPFTSPGCSAGTCGECQANSDCPGTMTCGANNECACATNTDCAWSDGGSTAPVCGSNGICGCTNGSCGSGLVCDSFPLTTPSGACVTPCSSSASCTAPQASVCNTTTFVADGGINADVCVQCTSDTQCTSPSAPHCSVYNTCQQCRTDSDCSGTPSTPHCSGAGACVQCTSPSQCSAPATACDSLFGRCGTGCIQNTDCTSGVCNADGGCS